MAEIERYGPISCGMSSANLSNYTPNTMINNNGSKKVDHFVTVFGWG